MYLQTEFSTHKIYWLELDHGVQGTHKIQLLTYSRNVQRTVEVKLPLKSKRESEKKRNESSAIDI